MKNRDEVIERYIIEIKPKRQTLPPKQSPRKKSKTFIAESKTYAKNLAKWEAAEEFCKDNGIKFKIITEEELKIR
jgi:hypothetical protein